MRTRGRLIALIAAGAVVLIALAFGGIIAMNATVFSAAGTVTSYFDALARGDAASALAVPGVVPDGLSPKRRVLLDGAAFHGPTDVSVTTESESAGHATVVASFRLDGTSLTQKFRLSKTDAPVFNEWSFDESPLASLTVSVTHGTEFQVGHLGSVDIAAYPGGEATLFSGTATFPVFSGVSYRVFRDRPLVTADAVTAIITKPGEQATVAIMIEPTKEFTSSVKKGLDAALNDCTTQKVLKPTDCPFGYTTSNRFVGEPTWTMVKYPEIMVSPGDNSWRVTGHGTAHITGKVQSLYDGSITPVDVDSTFSVLMRAWALDDGTRLDLRP